MPLGVGGDDPVADRCQGDLRPLALGVEGVLHLLALHQLLAGAQERQKDQHAGGRQVGHQQQPEQRPRAFAKGVAEGLGRRRDLLVDRVDLALPLEYLLGAGLPGADPRAHPGGDVDQFHDVLVAHQPQLDGPFEIAEVVEVAVQPDDRGNVVGVVAALEDTLPRRLDVGVGLVQRQAHLAVAEGNRDGFLVAMEVFVGTRVGVQGEIVDGVLLALRPEAFATDVAAHRGEDIETASREHGLQQHHDDEGPYQAEQAGLVESPVLPHSIYHSNWRKAIGRASATPLTASPVGRSRSLRRTPEALPCRKPAISRQTV